jgi:hypothetical protein
MLYFESAMSTLQTNSPNSKKPSTKKATALRDIALKKNLHEDSFTVHRIKPEDQLTPHVHQNHEADFLEKKSIELEIDHDLPRNSRESIFPAFSLNAPVTPARVETQDPAPEPKELIKVKFPQFVKLVASHDFDEVIKNNEQEEVVLSSNLLTDLAASHDEREGRKVPLVFLVGLAIGVVLTYILITK